MRGRFFFEEACGSRFIRVLLLGVAGCVWSAKAQTGDPTPSPDSVVVSIAARFAATSEPMPPNNSASAGQFLLRRSGPTTSSLRVYLRHDGTATWSKDYTLQSTWETIQENRTIGNSVVFPAWRSEVNLLVLAQGDGVLEHDETAVLTLVAGPTGGGQYLIDPAKSSATVTIQDEDEGTTLPVVRIDVLSPEIPETMGQGLFAVRRTGPTNDFLSVNLAFGGTAVYGEDYSPLTNVVRIFPGHFEARFNVRAKEDNLVEGNESFVAEVAVSTNSAGQFPYIVDGANARAGATIVDMTVAPTNVVISVEATQAETWEPYPESLPGRFTIRRTGPMDSSLTVFMFLGGSATLWQDYTADTNSVVFQPGESEVIRDVTALPDDLVETNETVFLQLVGRGQFYTVDLTKARATVTIKDRDSLPVVSVEATRAETREPFPESLPGRFTIRRSGPTESNLTVFMFLGGTAALGRDYTANTNSVEFLPGQSEVNREVTALPDSLLETNETVFLQLVGRGQHYNVDQTRARATVTILDRQPGENLAPTAVIRGPSTGAVYTVGDPIEIIAEASDPDGFVRKLELFSNGELVRVTYTNRLVVRWPSAPAGQYVLVAVATDNLGKRSESSKLTILVRERNTGAFVVRNLPDAYTPGVSFRVELRAEPPTSARAYAVEDRPPEGWQVSNVNHEGLFDPVTRKVKFGPYTDGLPRTLMYDLHPPTLATGRREFVGNGSLDGVSYPIGGDQFLGQVSTNHPADLNPVDFRIVLDEVTAYAAAWKSENSRTNPIPINYVTRAGFLWKRGEAYRFVPAAGVPPNCWVPVNAFATALAATLTDEPFRTGPELFRPGIAAEMQISVTTPTGTSAYAVEEQIPSGWSVAEISDGGTFDASSSTIRWGVFYDSASRVFRYTVTPPANISEVGRLRGVASFDGVEHEVAGSDRILSMEESNLPKLGQCAREEGGIRVRLQGPAGQVGVLQRSRDLVSWEDVTLLFLPDGALEYLDKEGSAAHLFYRLQVR